jgi:hypothetical protein
MCHFNNIYYKKIYNLNKPFDENKFIEQYVNQLLKNKFTLESIPQTIPVITSYYVGII